MELAAGEGNHAESSSSSAGAPSASASASAMRNEDDVARVGDATHRGFVDDNTSYATVGGRRMLSHR